MTWVRVRPSHGKRDHLARSVHHALAGRRVYRTACGLYYGLSAAEPRLDLPEDTDRELCRRCRPHQEDE